MSRVSEIMENMEYGPSVEDSGAVRDWLRDRSPFGHFIGGKFTGSGTTFTTRDPSTGEVLAEVTQGGDPDVAEAVRAARSAQAGWAGRTAYNRGQVLYRVAEMLDARSDEFATLLRDGGRSDESARHEVEFLPEEANA